MNSEIEVRAIEPIRVAYMRYHGVVTEANKIFREVFIKGPGMLLKGNPEKYITEIQFPIQEG